MWLNQQTFDAIRILLHLAQTHPALSRASDASAATGVTVMNVQKTVHALGESGLIEAVRGRNGGMRLGRAPDAITLAAIVRVFEPKDCPVSFLPSGLADARISAALFKAHRGFFQPLEDVTLGALMSDLSLSPLPGASAAAGTALRAAVSPSAAV